MDKDKFTEGTITAITLIILSAIAFAVGVGVASASEMLAR